jgi:TolA-binding protein
MDSAPAKRFFDVLRRARRKCSAVIPTAIFAWMGLGAMALPQAPEVAPAAGGGTIVERVTAARADFDAGRFAEAAEGFAGIERDYGQNPQATKVIAAHRALHAMAVARAGRAGDAIPLIEAAAREPETLPATRDLLAYLRAVCLYQLGKWPEAREALLAIFNNQGQPRARRLEAYLMAGSTFQKENDHEGAAKFFLEASEKLRKAEPALAARAGLISLQSRLQAGDLEGALASVRAGYLTIREQPQIITFQMLTLDLGNRFLAEKKWLEAIVCFQRVWTRERLLRHQRDRIAAWQRERAVAAAQPDAPEQLPRLDGLIAAAEKEIATLEANPGFDAATRFRLANAFLQLGRHAEAATILGTMLESLPPDPIVEQSALALVQCWLQEKRWERAIAAVDLYEQRFGSNKIAVHHPDLLLLKAVALESDARYPEAADVCADLVLRFPKSDAAETAAFKHGWLLLMADRNEEGLKSLRAFPEKFPKSRLREDAAYWEGEALAMLGRHDEAREHLATYLADVKKKKWRGDYADGAAFRRAFCLFAAARYDDAITEFRAFLRAHEGSEYIDEAHLLLGDALGGVGKTDAALEAYAKIKPSSGRFHEEGIFKAGKVLKLTGEIQAMREHFEAFLKKYPRSSRAAEAVHWVSWTWQQEGDETKAREAAWDAFTRFGGDPEQSGVEDILEALAKMHRRDEESGNLFRLRLHELAQPGRDEKADAASRLLACRALWARARFVERTDPTNFRADMLAASALIEPKEHPPRLTVDIALALESIGLDERARELLAETRKWHPRTLEKARLYAALGRLAEKAGDHNAALAAYDRFDTEGIAPPADVRAEVQLARARLEAASGKLDSALARWKEIQTDRTFPARARATAFFENGRALAEKDPATAAPFFERVYVAFGGQHDLVAAAYLERARCLERLGENEKAMEVYRELANRDDLPGQEKAINEARGKAGTTR